MKNSYLIILCIFLLYGQKAGGESVTKMTHIEQKMRNNVDNFIFSGKETQVEASYINSISQLDSLFNGMSFDIDDSMLRADCPETGIKPIRNVRKENGLSFLHSLCMYVTPSSIEKPYYLIITTFSLFDSLRKEISTYVEDVHAIYGYGIYVEKEIGATPEQLKEIILNYQENLCGVLFIGNLGEAMYETDDDFNTYGYKIWPCDLFFMDLNGIWSDNDENGIYDDHSGNISPEIFFGRLSSAGMSSLGDETALLRRQLQESHDFWWKHSYNAADTALNYVYSDWKYLHIPLYPSYVFGNGKVEDVRYELNNSYSAQDYLNRLNQIHYGFTHLAVHSSPIKHDFRIPLLYPYVSVNDVKNNNSNNIAYNLFCCSACNWVAANSYGYLGGAYLFNQGKTVAVIGSTKIGGMYTTYDFYYSISQSKNIGESLLTWWRIKANSGQEPNYVSRYYGMTILGDPTINLRYNVHDRCVSILNLTNYPTDDNSNLILFKAAEKIKVSGNFVIPSGKHLIFDAPIVEFDSSFSCPAGSSIETRNEGCEL